LNFRVKKEINLTTSYPPAVEGLTEHVFRPDFAASTELTVTASNKWPDRFIDIAADFFSEKN